MPRKGSKTHDEPIKPDEVHLPARLSPDGQTRIELPVDGPEPDEDGEIALEGSERVRRAVLLRLSGATYEQISRSLGYANPEQARQAIHRSMDAVKVEAARELKRVAHMRLEHILMLLWPSVNSGDRQDMLIALTVIDRLERLHGLNYVAAEGEGPQSDAVLVVGGEKADFMQALQDAQRRQKGLRAV